MRMQRAPRGAAARASWNRGAAGSGLLLRRHLLGFLRRVPLATLRPAAWTAATALPIPADSCLPLLNLGSLRLSSASSSVLEPVPDERGLPSDLLPSEAPSPSPTWTTRPSAKIAPLPSNAPALLSFPERGVSGARCMAAARPFSQVEAVRCLVVSA